MDLGVPNYQAGPEAVRAKHQSWSIFGCYCCDSRQCSNTLVESAARLCDAFDAVIFLREGESLVFGAHHGPIPMDLVKWPLTRAWTAGRSVVDRRAVHVHDLPAAGAEFPEGHAMAAGQGCRTILSAPLLREGEAIGSLSVRRIEVRPFSDKQIELAATFADQAVIAIENIRLFDEVQARTREVQESLDYQTAISDVLNVISRSPNELQPVLDSIVKTSTRLCEAEYSVFFRRQDDGSYRIAATNNTEAEFIKVAREHPFEPTRASCTGRAVLERRTIHILDAWTDPEYHMPEFTRITKHRTLLGVPLARDDIVIGVIVLARTIVQPFTEKQIELVTPFASQALIAIENVRLFEAEQARSCELQESLQQQTATADVLKVISRLGVRAAACSRHLGRHCCAPVQCRNGVYFPSPWRGLSISGQLWISPSLRGISEGRGTISKPHHRYRPSRARRSSGPCGRYTRGFRI